MGRGGATENMKKRYGMVIDLKRCIGCDACTIACRQAKATSKGILFAKLFKYERGRYPHAKLEYLPVLCMHCAEPPCEEVCPTGATRKQDDGIVVVDSEKCIGCKYCIIACPYGARNAFRGEWTISMDKGRPLRQNGRKIISRAQQRNVTFVWSECWRGENLRA